MNIAVVILWYLIGYAGCVWALSRKYDVNVSDLFAFLIISLAGPFAPLWIYMCTFGEHDPVVIRRRK